MDFSLITGAVSAINSAIDIGKTAIGARDDAKASEVVRAMNEMLLNAQQRLFDLGAALNAPAAGRISRPPRNCEK